MGWIGMLEKARRIALYENPPGTTADSVGDAGGDVNRPAVQAPPRRGLGHLISGPGATRALTDV